MNDDTTASPVIQPLDTTAVLGMLRASKDAAAQKNPLIESVNARLRMLSALMDSTEASAVRYAKWGDRLTAQSVYEALDATKESQSALRKLHSAMLNDIASKSLTANNPAFAELTSIIESLDKMDDLRNQFRDGAQKRLDTVNAVIGSESKLVKLADRIHLTHLPVKEAEALMLFSADLDLRVEALNIQVQKSSASDTVKQYSTTAYNEVDKQLRATTVATRGILLDAGLSSIILNGAGVVHDLNAFVTDIPDKLATLKSNTKRRLSNILEHASVFGRSTVKTLLAHLDEHKEISDNKTAIRSSETILMELQKSREQTEKQIVVLTKAMDGVAHSVSSLADRNALSTQHIEAANAKWAFDASQLAKLQEDLSKITDKAGPLAAASANYAFYATRDDDLSAAHKPLLGKLGAAWNTMVSNIKNANAAITQNSTTPDEPKRIERKGPRG
jgi:predicted transcriptional regulator